ncbi:hypothetical protein YC2023_071518 [Brassica napus]
MYLRFFGGPPSDGGDTLAIKMKLGAAPVSRALYRYAPTEMVDITLITLRSELLSQIRGSVAVLRD